ncbi:MAG: glycosyltransferase family 4 protein [Bacteroidota bacterium]|nr:glycosyltransferase family 4 protein [Bacteroidota bacterium]
MKKIKILFTIPNFNTAGSGKVLLDIASNLDPQKFDVHICCFHDKGDFFKVVKDQGFPVHLFKFSTDVKLNLKNLKEFFQIIFFFKKHKFDVIHSWHWSSDFTEPLAAKLAGSKWLYTKKAMSWGHRNWKIKSFLADKIITINDEMETAFFSGNKNVSLIPLGLDIDYYKPLPKDQELLKKINIEEKDFVIVSIANMVPVKGIEILIDAIELLKQKVPKIKVFLVGEDNNEYGAFLKKKVKDLGLGEQIKFIGKILDVRPYHSIADVFVIPTKDEGRKEGMPMAPVEAMAAETLVLGSRISGVKYILKDFPELLFNASSVQNLYEKLIWVKEMDNAKKDELKKSLRDKVANEYNMELFIKNHENIYKEISS